MTAELIARTTFHNTCLVRFGTDLKTGWCLDCAVPVYRDGIDWHTDQDRVGLVFVLDAHRAHDFTSDRVTVAAPVGAPDIALAEAAGFDTRHTGFHVTRYVDGTALVLLHND